MNLLLHEIYCRSSPFTAWHFTFVFFSTEFHFSNSTIRFFFCLFVFSVFKHVLCISLQQPFILVMLNKLRSHAHFYLSANHMTKSKLLIWIHTMNDKQSSSRSLGFWRSHLLIWIYTVCKGRVYPVQQDKGKVCWNYGNYWGREVRGIWSEAYDQRHIVRGIWSEAYGQKAYDQRHIVRGIWSEAYDQRHILRGIWSGT